MKNPLLLRAFREDAMLRGGGWYTAPLILRSARRSYNSPTTRYGGFGFRVFRTQEES